MTLDDVWKNVQSALRTEIGEGAFKNWIAPMALVSCEDGLAVLSAPTLFFGNWVSRNYGNRVCALLTTYGQSTSRLEFCLATSPAQETTTQENMGATPHPTSPAQSHSPANPSSNTDDSPSSALPSTKLNKNLTFEKFIVGVPNQLAYAAAQRAAQTDETNFNPLFMYGGVGLGKTHLMHAIAWDIKSRKANARILYLSAEQFMFKFVQALRFKDTHAFKEMFRSVDVLMIDDVQFIAGKNSTQDEFFHTFNALANADKKIIISADRTPSEIDGLEERIKSRLQSGLIVDLHPTDYNLRLGILTAKVTAYQKNNPQIVFADGVLEFIADKISANVRVLEGVLNRLYAFGELIGREISQPMAAECLADILRSTHRLIRMEDIIRTVTEHYNLTTSDILSPRRAREVARPRQMAMYLAKKLTQKSLPEIGRHFGGRDHTTVIHAVRKIEELCTNDTRIAQDREALRVILER